MEIIVGKLAGFCGGVINSVSKTEELLNNREELYCLGELVHNKQVVDKLNDKGLVIIDSLDAVPNDSELIIRAHGVPESVYLEALKRNIKIYDLTCPNVLKIHDKAKKLDDEGYFIILIAQKTHPEAIGTISFCGENSVICENEEDLNSIIDYVKKNSFRKVAIISQTTFSVLKFNDFVKSFQDGLRDIELLVDNTICSATELRQKETEKIAKEVEAMIIIGGKNSSNTKKLYELSLIYCKNVFIIETLDDLKDEMNLYNKVGVMAGASTPKDSIENVIKHLESL